MDICVSMKEVDNVDDKLAEYRKCAEDPIYFIEKYVTHLHPVKGSVTAEMYPHQKEILKMILRSQGRAGCLNVARQMGLSHVIAGYAVWHLTFKPREKMLSIHAMNAQAQYFKDDVLRKLKNLPDWLQVGIEAYTYDTVRMLNGAMLISTILTKHTGRGLSLSTVFVQCIDHHRSKKDQAAYLDMLMSVCPGLVPNGKVVLTTSGAHEGPIGDLIKFCKESDHEYLEVKWSAHPERDEEWRDHMQSICSALAFSKEFECQFISEDSSGK